MGLIKWNTLRARLIGIIGGAVIIPLIAAALLLIEYQQESAANSAKTTFSFAEKLLGQQLLRKIETTNINTRHSADMFFDTKIGDKNSEVNVNRQLASILSSTRLDGLFLFDDSAKLLGFANAENFKSGNLKFQNLATDKSQSEISAGFFAENNFIFLHSVALQLGAGNLKKKYRLVGVSILELWAIDQVREITKIHISLLNNNERKLTTIFDKFGQNRLLGTVDLRKLGFSKADSSDLVTSDDGKTFRLSRNIADLLTNKADRYSGSVLFEASSAVVLNGSSKSLTMMLMIIALAIILSAMSGVLLTKMILAPIQKLQYYVQTFALQSSHARASDLSGLDFATVVELEGLLVSFKNMTKKIGESFARIKRINGATKKIAVTFEQNNLHKLSAFEICKALDAGQGFLFIKHVDKQHLGLVTVNFEANASSESEYFELFDNNLLDLARKKNQVAFLSEGDDLRNSLIESQHISTKNNKFLYVPLLHDVALVGFMVFTWKKEKTISSELVYVAETLAASLVIQLQNINFLAQTMRSAELESELRAAKAVQDALIPSQVKFPGLDIFARVNSAAITGGDWYGFFYHQSRHELDIFIADITGHGFPSALLTGVLCGAINASEETCKLVASENTSTSERLLIIADVLNKVIVQAGKTERVASMLLMSLSLDSGKLMLLNGGHKLPYLVQVQDQKVQALINSGPLIGLEKNPRFDLISVDLQPGDIIFAYTDGLVENGASEAEPTLSTRKLKELLEPCKSASEIHSNIDKYVQKMIENDLLVDDVTTLTLAWNGSIGPVNGEYIVGISGYESIKY